MTTSRPSRRQRLHPCGQSIAANEVAVVVVDVRMATMWANAGRVSYRAGTAVPPTAVPVPWILLGQTSQWCSGGPDWAKIDSHPRKVVNHLVSRDGHLMVREGDIRPALERDSFFFAGATINK